MKRTKVKKLDHKSVCHISRQNIKVIQKQKSLNDFNNKSILIHQEF